MHGKSLISYYFNTSPSYFVDILSKYHSSLNFETHLPIQVFSVSASLPFLSYSFQLIMTWSNTHCVKSIHIQSFSGPNFSVFGLRCTIKWNFPLRISPINVTKFAVSCGFDHIYWRTERCEVSLGIQSEYGKIQTRKTPDTNTFHAVTTKLVWQCFGKTNSIPLMSSSLSRSHSIKKYPNLPFRRKKRQWR